MGKVSLAHGAGGREMAELLERLLLRRVESKLKKVEGGLGIDHPDDGALIPVGDGFLVVSTDSYTVSPIFFPGGDIGKLAICGSINDVLMMGGSPMAMLDSIVVEEGFPMETLRRIVDSMIETLRGERIPLIGGDFKVMPKGGVDGIVITTTCMGWTRNPIVDLNLKPGDAVMVSGYLGEHGATIMALQHGLKVEAKVLRSDVKPLTSLLKPLMERYPNAVRAAGDPTRGGLSMLLNNWAKSTGTLIAVEEGKIPLSEPVRKYSDMLGIDPLHLASEGVAVIAVDSSAAEEVLEFTRSLGFERAEIIGWVKSGERFKGLVLLRSEIGGLRVLEPPMGEIVPRIC